MTGHSEHKAAEKFAKNKPGPKGSRLMGMLPHSFQGKGGVNKQSGIAAYTPNHKGPSPNPSPHFRPVYRQTPRAERENYDFRGSESSEHEQDDSAYPSDPVAPPQATQKQDSLDDAADGPSARPPVRSSSGYRPFARFGKFVGNTLNHSLGRLIPNHNQHHPAPMKQQAKISDLFQSQAQQAQSEAVPSCAPPGMRNHGNTCYMNAVLQVLFNLAPFTEELLALQVPQDHTTGCPTRESSGIGGSRGSGGDQGAGNGQAVFGSSPLEVTEDGQGAVAVEAGPADSSLPAAGIGVGSGYLDTSPQATLNSTEHKQPASNPQHCTHQQLQQEQQGAASPLVLASPRSRRTMRRMQRGAGQQQQRQQQQQQQQQQPMGQEQQQQQQQQGFAAVEDPLLVGKNLPPRGVTRALLNSLQEYREVTAYNYGPPKSSDDPDTKPRRPCISPLPIKRAMCGPQWAGFRQQDTHEYFVALLDQLQHEVLGAQVLATRGAQGAGANPSSGGFEGRQSGQQGSGGGCAHECDRKSDQGHRTCKHEGEHVPSLPRQAAVKPEGRTGEAVGVKEEGGQGQGGEVDGEQLGKDHKGDGSGDGQNGCGENGIAMQDGRGQGVQGEVKQEVHGQQGRGKEGKDGTNGEQQQGEQKHGEGEGAHGAHGPPSLAATAARMSLSGALCPGVRTFSGCLRYAYVCRECGHETQNKEPFTHLSLQLPASQGLLGPSLKTNLENLLKVHFEKEEVEKVCERCGAKAAKHILTREVLRLPRVLVLHLMRFSPEPPLVEGGEYSYFKLHTPITLNHPKPYSLGPLCVEGVRAHPLLATHAARVFAKCGSGALGRRLADLLEGSKRPEGSCSDSGSDKENGPADPPACRQHMQQPNVKSVLGPNLTAQHNQSANWSPLVVGDMGQHLGASIGSSSGIGLQHPSNGTTTTTTTNTTKTPPSNSKDLRPSNKSTQHGVKGPLGVALTPAALGPWESPHQRGPNNHSPGLRGGSKDYAQQQPHHPQGHRNQAQRPQQQQQQHLHYPQDHRNQAQQRPQQQQQWRQAAPAALTPKRRPLDNDLRAMVLKPDEDGEAEELSQPHAPSYPTEDEQLAAAIAASKREHEEEQRRRWQELEEASKHAGQAAGGAGVGRSNRGSGSKSGSAGADAGAGGLSSSGSGSRNVHSSGGVNGGAGSGVGREGEEGGGFDAAVGGVGAQAGRDSTAQGGPTDMAIDDMFDEDMDEELLRAIELSKQDQGPRSQAPPPRQLNDCHSGGQPWQSLLDLQSGEQDLHHHHHHQQQQQQQQQAMPPPRQQQQQRQEPRQSGEYVRSAEGAQGGGSFISGKRARRERGESLGGSQASRSVSGDAGGGVGVEMGRGPDAEGDGEDGNEGSGKKTKHAHSPSLATDIRSAFASASGRGAPQGHGTHAAGQQHGSHHHDAEVDAALCSPPPSPETPHPGFFTPAAAVKKPLLSNPFRTLHVGTREGGVSGMQAPQQHGGGGKDGGGGDDNSEHWAPGMQQQRQQQQHGAIGAGDAKDGGGGGADNDGEHEAPGMPGKTHRGSKRRGGPRDPHAPIVNLADDEDGAVEDNDEELQMALAESLKSSKQPRNIWEEYDNEELAEEYEGASADEDGPLRGKSRHQGVMGPARQLGWDDKDGGPGAAHNSAPQAATQGEGGDEVMREGTGQVNGGTQQQLGVDGNEDRAGRGDDPCLPHVLLEEEEVSGESSSGSRSWSKGEPIGDEEASWGEGGNDSRVGVGDQARKGAQLRHSPGMAAAAATAGAHGKKGSGIAAQGAAASKALLKECGTADASCHKPPRPARRRLPLLHELAQYRLHGCVCHRGPTPFSGHYIADVALPPHPQQNSAGVASGGDKAEGVGSMQQQEWQWWRFDDTDVSALDPDTALQEQGADGYLLFLVCDPTAAADDCV